MTFMIYILLIGFIILFISAVDTITRLLREIRDKLQRIQELNDPTWPAHESVTEEIDDRPDNRQPLR